MTIHTISHLRFRSLQQLQKSLYYRNWNTHSSCWRTFSSPLSISFGNWTKIISPPTPLPFPSVCCSSILHGTRTCSLIHSYIFLKSGYLAGNSAILMRFKQSPYRFFYLHCPFFHSTGMYYFHRFKLNSWYYCLFFL